MPRGGPQATQQIDPCGSSTTLNEQASPTASSSHNSASSSAPSLPQRSNRMKRVFGRRNSLSQQQFMPTPFTLHHAGSPTPTEEESPSPHSECAQSASTEHGISRLSSDTSLGGAPRPVPPDSYTSRKPLRHLIPASFFHPASSSSSSNKRSIPPTTTKASSPPPIPPPKPSKLRVVGSASDTGQTRTAHSSGSEYTSNGFGQNAMGDPAVDYNPSGFRFPQQFPAQSESSSKHSQPDLSLDSRYRGPLPHVDSTLVPHQPARSKKTSKHLLDLRKRRSASFGDIAAFPTSSSSTGLRFPVPVAGARSSDSVATLSAAASDRSNSGETSPGSAARGCSQSRSTSLAFYTPPHTVLATLPSRYRVASAADAPYRSSPEPTKSLASSISSGSPAPSPPRHPGATSSLSVPGRPATADRIGRSSSPLRDTARSAAVGGLLLGRKGWDRMERLWTSTTSSSGASRLPTHLGHRNAESSLSSTDLSTTSSLGDKHITILSACLRPPYKPGGRLVFGRCLADATRDTAIDPTVSELDPWMDEKGLPRGENCPALVVRCVQHLEKWGIEEEGVFRIPGRNTHTSMLRSEFDAGADYDLRQSDPGDLDPHSVSSVFKKFLRDMPEPIVTHALSPAFEALNSASPLGFESQRMAPRPLISKLQRLIWQLPVENRSILQELCRLLRRTSEHSATTKMPLSNLALVFCPTLSMHPNLFRLLVQTQDYIFEPMPSDPPAESDQSSEVNADQSSEESELDKPKQALLLHQRSISDMKLVHLTEMSQRNKAFGRTPSAPLAPIIVPISVSASPSAHSTSASTSYTSSDTPSSNTDSSAATSPNYSTQSALATWGRASRKHLHNFSLPPPAALSHAFADPFSSSSSIPFRNQRDRQGSTTSTIDEENDTAPSRSRTPSTLRSLSTLLGARSRSNTSPNGAVENPPATSTPRNGDTETASSGSSTPVRLSRRSSSFFPTTPRLDKLEWGFGPRSGASLPSRVRKGSVGNLKSLVSAPLEAMPQPQKMTDKLRPPHLSMTIPGGGTGVFLTSPISSPMPSPSPSSPTPTATAPISGRPSESLSGPVHVRMASNGTVTANKRWSGTSSSSKRWSGTGSTMTGGRSSKRASWSEPPPAVPAILLDSTPAIGSSSFSSPNSPTAGISNAGLPSLGVMSATPIADLFRGSSSSLNSMSTLPPSTSRVPDVCVSPANDTVGVDIATEGTVQRRRPSGTFPFPGLPPPPPLPARAGNRPLPTPPSHPPSSFVGASAGHVQDAIAALTQVKQSSLYAQNARTGNSSTLAPPPTLTVDESSSHSLALPPRLSVGGLRKKHWSRISPVSTGAVKESDDDWASSVLAQITAGAAQVAASPVTVAGNAPAALSSPGTSSAGAAEGKEESPIVEASSIPDGTVRDARRIFEAAR